jgi:SAM-dependent methyltransferase
MILEGDLSSEILAALRDADKTLLGHFKKEEDPIEPNDYVKTKMELFQEKLEEIWQATGAKAQQLWNEAAGLYLAILEHKSSYYANLASLDYLSQLQDIVEKVRAGKVFDVLDLCSGPTTFKRALNRKLADDVFRRRGFRANVTSYDHSEKMHALGLEGERIVGALDRLDEAFAPGRQFDIVNLSYALRYAAHPAKLIATIHQLLTIGGHLVVILPQTNQIPPRFFDAMRDAGFIPKVLPTEKLISELDPASRRHLREVYGDEFAHDVENETKARFTYFVAEKQEGSISHTLNDDDFRVVRVIPVVNAEKVEKIRRTAGRYRLVPETAIIRGVVVPSAAAEARVEKQLNYRKFWLRMTTTLGRLGAQTARHGILNPWSAAGQKKRDQLDGEILESMDVIGKLLDVGLMSLPLAVLEKLSNEIMRLLSDSATQAWFENDPLQRLQSYLQRIHTVHPVLQEAA